MTFGNLITFCFCHAILFLNVSRSIHFHKSHLVAKPIFLNQLCELSPYLPRAYWNLMYLMPSSVQYTVSTIQILRLRWQYWVPPLILSNHITSTCFSCIKVALCRFYSIVEHKRFGLFFINSWSRSVWYRKW